MANPRQRRKQRSSAASGSSHTSKRAQRKKLHRAPPIKGPAAALVADQWDRTKTVRQNYAALGLVGDGLSLRPSGGVERGVDDVLAQGKAKGKGKGKGKAVDGGDDSHEADGSSTTTTTAKPLRKGLGRIIRDDQGNVLDIIEGDDDEDTRPHSAETPWGKPLNADWERLEDAQRPAEPERAHLPALVGPQTQAGQKVIASLEQRAATAAPVHRHSSALEADWLRTLVQTHGDDVDAMARDPKRNIWQKTAGEIRRA
ncbi:Nucleolar protein 16, partial [Tilletia horrida]